jgi:glucose-1-phosphate thymidylyltransferase
MCLEEIGLELGYLTPNAVLERAGTLGDTEYARYLRRRVADFSDA